MLQYLGPDVFRLVHDMYAQVLVNERYTSDEMIRITDNILNDKENQQMMIHFMDPDLSKKFVLYLEYQFMTTFKEEHGDEVLAPANAASGI